MSAPTGDTITEQSLAKLAVETSIIRLRKSGVARTAEEAIKASLKILQGKDGLIISKEILADYHRRSLNLNAQPLRKELIACCQQLLSLTSEELAQYEAQIILNEVII